MKNRTNRISSDAWIKQIFISKQAKNGGVVRRKIRSVEKFASHESLQKTVQNKNHHMIMYRGQYIIFCDDGEFKFVC